MEGIMERLIRRIRALLIEMEIKKSIKRIEREIGPSPDWSRAYVEWILKVSTRFSVLKQSEKINCPGMV